jgi:hypothetical protein
MVPRCHVFAFENSKFLLVAYCKFELPGLLRQFAERECRSNSSAILAVRCTIDHKSADPGLVEPVCMVLHSPCRWRKPSMPRKRRKPSCSSEPPDTMWATLDRWAQKSPSQMEQATHATSAVHNKHNSEYRSLHCYVGDDVPAPSLLWTLACTFTHVSRCSGQCSCWCFMQQ